MMVQSFASNVVLLAIVALGAAACVPAKETREIQTVIQSSDTANGSKNGSQNEPKGAPVNPNSYLAKSDFEGKTFSLVRGIEEADGSAPGRIIPGMSEDFGFVNVRITEDEIQFIRAFDPTNKAATQSIVASYRVKDQFDLVTQPDGSVAETRAAKMKDRRFMRVDWANPTNEKSRTIDGEVGAVVGENVLLLEEPKLESGHFSWLTEMSLPRGTGWWGANPNSRVVLRTHLMPVKPSDYQRVNYRDEDFKRFGFFFTQQNFANPEKGLLDSELQNNTFANLHNVCEPGRKDASGNALSCSTAKIVWHLNRGFPAKYKDVAKLAVSEWNETFKTALGRTDDVVVLDEATEVGTVDPRYNVIAHYGSKSSGGLLGVAQWASNPVTGELLGVRATVYEDGIRSTLGMVDAIITMILEDDEIRKAFLATDAETKARIDTFFRKKTSGGARGNLRALRSSLGLEGEPAKRDQRLAALGNVQSQVPAMAQALSEPPDRAIERKRELMKNARGLFATSEQAKLGGSLASYDEAFGILGASAKAPADLPALGGIEHLHNAAANLREERERMINQAETGTHGTELVEEAALRYIKKVLAAHPEASDFAAQVKVIKEEVDQKTFYTTLVHEMGHAFGLRHNFQGSADAAHYHPEFFKLSQKIEAEKSLPDSQKTVTEADLQPYMFSSIMDYGGDFYSQVGGLGPYDKAAIRYAYNRSIDKKNDPVVKANYAFCTDHQVNETVLCRRFDKGRNVSEITFNLIETYQTNWVLSHFRRDRATFEQRARAYPMNALTRYFIPVRQVMDEFMFTLINAKKVKAAEGECDTDYWRESIDRGEVVNVCNPIEAEQVGVDPTNIETFEAGLFDQSGLRKEMTSYKPYGLADLLFANAIAKQFFAEVLGSTEPGRYLALDASGELKMLLKLPDGDIGEVLTSLLAARGIPATPDLLDKLKQRVGEVKIGRYGKPLNSVWNQQGSVPKQLNIGAFWDKYIAIVALGLKDLGVQKYRINSMGGNAYFYPQTQGFTETVLKAMITQTKRLVAIPFTTPAGVFNALAEPSLNGDLRSISTITALTDFVSDSDQTIVDKLRVCSLDERGCRASFGQKVARFTTAGGQEVFRATQTQNGDSIVFDLVKSASDVDKQRQDWVKKNRSVSDVAAENILKMTRLADQRAHVEKVLTDLAIPELTAILPNILSDSSSVPSVWNIITMLVTQGERLPTFSTLNLAQQARGIAGQSAKIIVKALNDLDPTGQCKLPETPEETAPLPGGQELPPVTGLSGLFSQKFSSRLAGEAGVAEPAPASGAAAAPVDCAAIAPRREQIMAAIKVYQPFLVELMAITDSIGDAKATPLRLKRITDELERAEASVRMIRRVSHAAGHE